MATLEEMIAMRLARAEARLTLYLAAEDAILNHSQSYSIGNRTLTRADLGKIATEIQRLETEIMQLNRNGAIRIQRVVPRDL